MLLHKVGIVWIRREERGHPIVQQRPPMVFNRRSVRSESLGHEPPEPAPRTQTPQIGQMPTEECLVGGQPELEIDHGLRRRRPRIRWGRGWVIDISIVFLLLMLLLLLLAGLSGRSGIQVSASERRMMYVQYNLVYWNNCAQYLFRKLSLSKSCCCPKLSYITRKIHV